MYDLTAASGPHEPTLPTLHAFPRDGISPEDREKREKEIEERRKEPSGRKLKDKM